MRSLIFLALFGLGTAMPRAARDKPNFIMFFVDDLGFGDTGFTGHPTAETPNIDSLAHAGRKLTTWYSGCPVCSGSRAALMTGRQFERVGVPGVFSNTVTKGLPLNETTVAEQLKTVGYATGAVGKWHLGQRRVYLPHNRGFDSYLGIPFSTDMGQGWASSCGSDLGCREGQADDEGWNRADYARDGYLLAEDVEDTTDPGGAWTPLVHQADGVTTVVEQPVDFMHLGEKYSSFATSFVEQHKSTPFFLYVPFSHVHTTKGNMPEKQYAGCNWKNTSLRGPFGDALSEVDWIIGNVHEAVKSAGIEDNTLFLFTGDNGPWMKQGLSGGSTGLFTGRYSGYWNTGKGSTWEGGIREPAFVYWKGQVTPFSRTAEIVSSLDFFPTLSKLAGASLPSDRVYDGRDMSDVLLKDDGKSKHDFLFFYGGCGKNGVPSAVRHGKWKAHWCTGPGLGGCTNCEKITYDPPLLFNVDKDPSEAEPVNAQSDEAKEALKAIQTAYETEVASFTTQELIAEPDEEGEFCEGDVCHYGVCCDISQDCHCTGPPVPTPPPAPPAPPSICPGSNCPDVPAENYLGCYKDKVGGDCDFEFMITGVCNDTKIDLDPQMSMELCNARCLEAHPSVTHFGLQSGGHGCFCGTSFGTWGRTDDEGTCSSACPGKSTEKCGGGNANAVYKVQPVSSLV